MCYDLSKFNSWENNHVRPMFSVHYKRPVHRFSSIRNIIINDISNRSQWIYYAIHDILGSRHAELHIKIYSDRWRTVTWHWLCHEGATSAQGRLSYIRQEYCASNKMGTWSSSGLICNGYTIITSGVLRSIVPYSSQFFCRCHRGNQCFNST